MNIKEIIDNTRSDILDDTVRPYLWTDLGLITCLNRAYDELARDTWCIIDSETTAVCRVPLLAYQTLHSLHAKIVNVFDARLESNGHPLRKKTEAYMSGMYNWRASTGTPYLLVMDSTHRKFSAYPKYDDEGYILGASDISFDSASKTISTAVSTSDFSAGDSFAISGTTSNNGTFTVDSVGATSIVTVEALVDEALTSALIQLERDAAILRVARLPLVPYVPNDLELAIPPTPEIDASDHHGLMNGIAKYAYMKRDSETYDAELSARHAGIFQQFKDDLRLRMLILTSGNELQGSPHLGTL